MSTATSWEPSAWLRRRITEWQQQVNDLELTPDEYGAVVAPLGGHCDPGSRQDFTCDRCGTYLPDGLNLGAIGAVRRDGLRLLITYGLCDGCHSKENLP